MRRFTIWPLGEGQGLDIDQLPAAWLEQFTRSPFAHRLTDLHLVSMTADGIRSLCRPRWLNLERLELGGRFTADNVRQLGCSELTDTLHELRFSCARLGDAGVTALVRDDWRKVTHLGLRDNRLTTASLSALAAAIFTPRLVKLDLSGNHMFRWDKLDFTQLHELANALSPDRLEHLDLARTGLTHVPDFLGERFGERVTV